MRIKWPTFARAFPRRAFLLITGGVALLLLVPVLAPNPLLLHLWIMVFLAVAQGAAWNVLGGYAGQYSVGHASYFGIGAYTTMLSAEVWHIAPGFGVALATVNTLLLALAVGAITFRLRGPYFVLASISVTEIIRLAALHWKDATRGAEGLLLTQAPTVDLVGFHVSFATKGPFFYASLGLVLLIIAVTWLLQNSKLGYYLQAIREDQDAASSLGINVTLYKNVALSISAVFTAWTGSLWALYVKFVDPNLAFGIDVSIQMVLIAIIGGIGTILGPVVGAFVLVLLSETLRNPKWLVAIGLLADDSGFVAFVEQRLSHAHVLFYGLLVVLVILFAPSGVLGLLRTAAIGTRRRLGAHRAAVQG